VRESSSGYSGRGEVEDLEWQRQSVRLCLCLYMCRLRAV
jgi:hypothetical protein